MATSDGDARQPLGLRFIYPPLALRALLALMACLAGPGAAATPATNDSEAMRPNVLWIVADDKSPDVGAYGDRYAVTPNLDRLASQGARFDRAFSVSGVCAPSRAALLTGMFPTSIGAQHMRSTAVPPPEVHAFTEELRRAGYYTANWGKTDYNLHPDAQTNTRSAVLEAPLGAFDRNVTSGGPWTLWRDREPGQPFFVWINLFTTHESRIRLDDEAFEELVAPIGGNARHEPAAATLPPYYPDSAVIRRDWARYHDLVTRFDQQVGEILSALEADGLAKSTAVFVFGDHGRGLPRAKRWIYDSGIRVPLLVRWPGTVQAGSVREDLVSFVDFAPTLLSMAGVAPPSHMQGRVVLGTGTEPEPDHIFAARDRMDEVGDTIRAVRSRDFKYVRNLEPDKPYSLPIEYLEAMPTMAEWRRQAAAGKLTGAASLFFRQRKPHEELYDVRSDPHEIVNLADRTEHAARLRRMSAELDAWMERTGDPGVLPEAELIERMQPGRPTAPPQARYLDGPGDAQAEPTVGTDAMTRRLSLVSETEGATIVYRFKGANESEPAWRLYHHPLDLAAGTKLHARAGRLGFRDSETVAMIVAEK